MTKKHVLFLANLTSGTGSIRQQFPEVLTILASHGCETLVYPIDPAAGLTSEKILSEAEHHYDCILVAGGDGTLNHVINVMMHLDIHMPISYLPAGSANDFSKTLTGGKALSVQEIAESTAGSHVYAYDIGKFGDSHFNYIAAFGAFTNVSYETSQESKNRFGYNAYVLQTIANLQSGLSYRETMQIEHDGIIETGDYIFGAVCNTTSIGGMETPLLKDTKLDDGLFECLLIKAPNNLIDYNSIMADFNGRTSFSKNPFATVFQTRSVTFRPANPIAWTLDGEDGGSHQEVTVSVVPQGMKILIPEEKQES